MIKTCLNIDCPERKGGKCNAMEKNSIQKIVDKWSTNFEVHLYIETRNDLIDNLKSFIHQNRKELVEEIIKFIDEEVWTKQLIRDKYGR